MTSNETVGEYLARARTLIKSKIESGTMWHTEFDDTDTYHICNRLLKTGLKSRILRRVSQFKLYKAFFDHIKDEWEWSYFMEDPVRFISYNFTGTQQVWSATEHELYAIYITI